jgi:hypothetical protein
MVREKFTQESFNNALSGVGSTPPVLVSWNLRLFVRKPKGVGRRSEKRVGGCEDGRPNTRESSGAHRGSAKVGDSCETLGREQLGEVAVRVTGTIHGPGSTATGNQSRQADTLPVARRWR